MTTMPPVNSRANCAAVFDEQTFDRDHVPAGHFHFFVVRGSTEPAGMLFGCPCGCGELKHVDFKGHADKRPMWEWDGNRDRPTLSPSINILQFDESGNRAGEHWHGWLRAGQFTSV